jgi:hypothetical protein
VGSVRNSLAKQEKRRIRRGEEGKTVVMNN